MSVLLQAQREVGEAYFLPALRTIMMSDCLAHPLNNYLFRTSIALSNKNMLFLWQFQPTKTGNLRLNIRPQFEQLFGALRVDCQRGFVDLLRVIGACNREKGRTMSFVVTQYSFVEIATMFPAEYLKDARFLRKLVKNTVAQLPGTLERLLTAIRPFLQEEVLAQSKEGMDHNAVTFLKQSHKWLQLARQNQLEQRGEEGRIDEQRMAAFEKMKDALRIITTSKETFLQTTLPNDSTFSEWTNRNKSHPLTRGTYKNVFSVKVLAQTAKSTQKDNSGSHCRILLATYRLTIAFSVNSEIAKAAKQLRNPHGSPVVEQTTKQFQLAKKQMKNPYRQSSKNSFLNELDFIYYIRDRSCRYVCTYYWQYQIKRQEASAILMDYYPHNLRQMLLSQGRLLSFREKLVLLQRIVAAVSWLASNFICHRDIKPENIMISKERVPKLVDFGSCCPVFGAGATHLHVTETRLLGTASYFSAFTEELSALYKKNEYEQHMLFDAYSLGKLMHDVLEEGVPSVLPNLAGLIGYIMDRCNEADPAYRMTYQEMLFLLQNLIGYLQRMEQTARE